MASVFLAPISVRRGISHWRAALIYMPIRLTQQKIKLSKIFQCILCPFKKYIHACSSLPPPSVLYIINLADLIYTQTFLPCPEFMCINSRLMSTAVWWWDSLSNKLKFKIWAVTLYEKLQSFKQEQLIIFTCIWCLLLFVIFRRVNVLFAAIRCYRENQLIINQELSDCPFKVYFYYFYVRTETDSRNKCQ